MFESRIAGQALLKPTSIDEASVLPILTSSFILSKISMLASTAMPTDRMNPPMWASSSVMGMSLNTASTMMA